MEPTSAISRKRVMRIVFPEGSGCVQKPEDLMFVMKVGTVDYYETPPQNKADLIQRLRGADAVFLDHSVLEAEVIQSGPKLKFICFFGIGYGNCINVAAATKQGVTVSYTPGYGATADLCASLPNVLLTPPTTRKRLGRTCSVSRTRPLTHSERRETPRGECRVNVVAGVPRLRGGEFLAVPPTTVWDKRSHDGFDDCTGDSLYILRASVL